MKKINEYWLWLNNVPDIRYSAMKKMLDYFGTPEEIYRASYERLNRCGVVEKEQIDSIIKSKNEFDAENMISYLKKEKIGFVTVDDKEYPERLKVLKDRPFCLYYKGNLPDNTPSVAIVGARGCSSYGIQIARMIGKELGDAGVQVISGMARGIDTYGHLGTLEAKGRTYAVLGCGADVCYPMENIEIYESISNSGGIISEYPPGTKPLGWHFPMRNRIISGLSDVVVVVEARKKSGSLITAETALDQGIDVMAVPGRITDVLSEGCNKLISDGAAVVSEVSDVLKYLGLEEIKKNEILNKGLEKEFEVVYSETDLSPVSLQELVDRTGMSSEQVYSILLKLQLLDLVYEPVKNYYARKC